MPPADAAVDRRPHGFMRWKCPTIPERAVAPRSCRVAGAVRGGVDCGHSKPAGGVDPPPTIRRFGSRAGPTRARKITQRLRQTWFTPGRPCVGGGAVRCRHSPAGWVSCARGPWRGSAFGARPLSLPVAGVHIVEATKQVYRADPGKNARRTRLDFRPLQPVLVPSSTATPG